MFRMNQGLMKSMHLLGAAVLLLSGGTAAFATPLNIAVAPNMKYAFADLQQAFTKQTGIEVKGVFGPSGQLTAQIKSGAPFDVFLSADMSYPDSLYKDAVAVSAPKIYADGVLVLWTMKPLDLNKGIQVLKNAEVKKIAVVNPELEAYGREAVNALDYFKLGASVKAKLVYGDSIPEVSQSIDSKSVDIGFTAKSAVLSPAFSGKGKWIELPKGSYHPLDQGAVILRYGSLINPAAARRFMDFLSSPAAREILEKDGYQLPQS